MSGSKGEKESKEEGEWNGDTKLPVTTNQPLHPTIDLLNSIDENRLGTDLCVLCGLYCLSFEALVNLHSIYSNFSNYKDYILK